MRYNVITFLKEGIFFIAALAVGIFIAHQHVGSFQAPVTLMPQEFSYKDVAILVVFFLFFSFIILRGKRLSGILLQFFFLVVIFFGLQLFFESFVPAPYNVLFAILVFLLIVTVRTVLTHNIAVLIGVAGISAIFGLNIRPEAGVILLALFSVYDVIAVYKTKHMVKFAERMIESGVIFGFLIPTRWRDFFLRAIEVRPGSQFMILGSGDIGLPIILISSLVSVSLFGAIFISLFSFIGLFVTHLIFVNQKERRPMAALPPIATFSIIGYLIFFLL